MSIYTTEREHQRLLEIAREYKERQYDVIIEPQAHQLPDFLALFKIDMLARNELENVIIEVRSQDSMTTHPELDAIARAVANKPGWRFELVVTNPKDKSNFQFKDAISLEDSDIVYRLKEARQLSDQEYGEAALLLAWSATEALLRSMAHKEDIPASYVSSGQLIKTLYSFGAIDEHQYQILQQVSHMRNMLVHGYKTEQPIATTLNMLFELINQILPSP